MPQGAFDHLRADPHGRVEGVGRALCDIGDARAAQALAHRPAAGHEVRATDTNLARSDAAAAAPVAQGREADGGFAGAGLADEAQHLAALQLQADRPPEPRRPALRRADDRSRGSYRSSALSLDAGAAGEQPVHTRLTPTVRARSRPPEERRIEAVENALLIVAHHAAPVRKGRLNAEAEIGEAGDEKEGEAEAQAEFGTSGAKALGRISRRIIQPKPSPRSRALSA